MLRPLRLSLDSETVDNAHKGQGVQSQMISSRQHQLSFACALQVDEQTLEELLGVIAGLWLG
jgi:hypothetical protein